MGGDPSSETPVMIGDKSHTHVCLACAEKIATSGDIYGEDAWKSALCNASNASNGWKHLCAAHPTHPLAIRSRERSVNIATQRLSSAAQLSALK